MFPIQPPDPSSPNYEYNKMLYNSIVKNQCDMPYYYTLTGDLNNQLKN
jgi:hypothetical protein